MRKAIIFAPLRYNNAENSLRKVFVMDFEKLAPASPQAVELRRDLHIHPELSGKEDRTAGLVAAWLEKSGLKVTRAPLPGRSLIGVLDTGRPGKTLALRADMDALPIVENACNLKREKTHVSEVEGVAHMCGHDFHTVGLLETARRLAAIKDELNGKIVFCFESGEEMGLGDDVRALLAEQGGADAVFSIHVQADYPVGTAVILDGSCTAGCETFRIDVKGKSAHGATPHLGLDPLNCAAQILVAANSIISRRVNSREAAVITPCQIHGGSTWNRIPDDCFMEGSTRFFDEQIGRDLRAMLDQTAAGVAAACGCEAAMSWRNLTLPVVNLPEVAELAREAARAAGIDVIAGQPWMASETYARFSEVCPTVMAFTGCANPETGCGAPQHSDRFEADERVLAVNAALTVEFAKRFLA